jgi:hypothetical protein
MDKVVKRSDWEDREDLRKLILVEMSVVDDKGFTVSVLRNVYFNSTHSNNGNG